MSLALNVPGFTMIASFRWRCSCFLDFGPQVVHLAAGPLCLWCGWGRNRLVAMQVLLG